MKYKGLEIMQMISKGQIEDGTRFNFENNNFNGEVEYYNGTLYWIRFDENWKETGKKNLFEMFNIQSTMVADFEPLKDEIEIDNIKETTILNDGMNYYEYENDGATESGYSKNYSLNDIDTRRKINELVRAVKQLNTELKNRGDLQ